MRDADAECPRCGIVFSKYREPRERTPLTVAAKTPDAGADVARGSWALLVGAESPAHTTAVAGRALCWLLFSVWTATLASSTVSAERTSAVLHLPNLVFHEAGHVLFMPFGRFVTVLGGSLAQVLIPLLCAGVLLWQTRDAFGAAIGVWWAGQNLTDVAPYINDARDLQLVLLGGYTGAEVEGHDWEYLLTATGKLPYDHTIARAVNALGNLTMIAALFWAAIVVLNQVRVLQSQREQA